MAVEVYRECMRVWVCCGLIWFRPFGLGVEQTGRG